jgi:hypothetical protein
MNYGILSSTKNAYDLKVYPVININSDRDNLSLPPNYDVIRLTSTSVVTITGIVGIKDKIFTIFNVGTFDIRFANLSSFSTPSNKVLVSTSSDVIISPNESITLFYDDASKLWRTAGVVKSSYSDLSFANVYEFGVNSAPSTATGSAGAWTWTLPASAKFLEVLAIGAGGGGGSGRRGASGTARFGGGGGAGGSASIMTTSTVNLTSFTVNVYVPVGGAGAAAVTTDNTDGNQGTGTPLWASVAFNGGGIYTSQIYAPNGLAGSGGTSSSGGGGTSVSNNSDSYKPTAGGSSSITGQAGMISNSNGFSGVSGPGGGGISASNVAYNGGATNFGGPPNPSLQSIFLVTNFATTLTGGNASTTAAAGSGSNGYIYGGGGAGGGASANGFNSGAGGNGRDGYVRIVVWG